MIIILKDELTKSKFISSNFFLLLYKSALGVDASSWSHPLRTQDTFLVSCSCDSIPYGFPCSLDFLLSSGDIYTIQVQVKGVRFLIIDHINYLPYFNYLLF